MIYAAAGTYQYKIEHMFDWNDGRSALFVAFRDVDRPHFAIILGPLARSGYKKKTYLQRPHGFFSSARCITESATISSRRAWATPTGASPAISCACSPILFLAFIWGVTGLPVHHRLARGSAHPLDHHVHFDPI
jgi:hypothetical protein